MQKATTDRANDSCGCPLSTLCVKKKSFSTFFNFFQLFRKVKEIEKKLVAVEAAAVWTTWGHLQVVLSGKRIIWIAANSTAKTSRLANASQARQCESSPNTRVNDFFVQMPAKKIAFVSPVVVPVPEEKVEAVVPVSPEKPKRSADGLTRGQVRGFASPESPSKRACTGTEFTVEVLFPNLCKQVLKAYQSEETEEFFHSLVLYRGNLVMLISPSEIHVPGMCLLTNLKYITTHQLPVLTPKEKGKNVQVNKVEVDGSETVIALPNTICSFDDFMDAADKKHLGFLCGKLSHAIKGEGKRPWKLTLVVGEGQIINITYFCASEDLGVSHNTFVVITNATKDIWQTVVTAKMGPDSSIIQDKTVFPSNFLEAVQLNPDQFLTSIPVESVSVLKYHQESSLSRDDVLVL